MKAGLNNTTLGRLDIVSLLEKEPFRFHNSEDNMNFIQKKPQNAVTGTNSSLKPRMEGETDVISR